MFQGPRSRFIVLALLLTLFSAPMVYGQEILFIKTSPDTVGLPEGVLEIDISSFTPILQVQINGEVQPIPLGEYLVHLKFPYKLQEGKNTFTVFVESEYQIQQKDIFVTYDPSKKPKEPGWTFGLISILGYQTTDNVTETPSVLDQKKASKTTFILLPSIAYEVPPKKKTEFKVIYMTSRYDDPTYKTKEPFYLQLNLGWTHLGTWAGDFSIGIGHDNIGLGDPEYTSDKRVSQFNEFKQVEQDTFFYTNLKKMSWLGGLWEIGLNLKQKNVVSDTSAAAGNEESGQNTTANVGYAFSGLGFAHQLAGSYEQNDAKGIYKDYRSTTTSWSISRNIDIFVPSFQYTQTGKQFLQGSSGANPLLTVKDTASLKLTVLFTKSLILAVSADKEKQVATDSAYAFESFLQTATLTVLF